MSGEKAGCIIDAEEGIMVKASVERGGSEVAESKTKPRYLRRPTMKLNLSTEGLARASSRRPWTTIGIWIVVIVAALGINVTLLADAMTTEFAFTNEPEFQRGYDLLEERLRGPRKAQEAVAVQSATLTVDDQAFRDRVEELYGQIIALGDDIIDGGTNYYQSGDQSLVSADRQTTILPIVMAGSPGEALENIEKVLDLVREANGRDGFRVLVAGSSSVDFESNELSEKDIARGEMIGVPVALIILVLLFGALLAAFIPIGLAIVAIIVALGATALVGQAVDVFIFAAFMIAMIGLAVGIDYSLIIVSRFREELRRGLDKYDAIARTGATASRTVFFSGVTVVVAMVGMLIIPINFFPGLAAGVILVVISAVTASLTLLPAVLSLLGRRVNALRVPFIGRRLDLQVDESSGGFWNWMTRNVMRHPVISLVVVVGLMLAAAVSSVDMNSNGYNGVDTLPEGTQVREAFELLEEKFSFGVAAPTEIVIDGDVNSQPVQAGIQRLRDAIATDPDFFGQASLVINEEGDLALLTTAVAGDTGSNQAVGAVRKLRDRYIPEAFAGVQADVLVTGLPAVATDAFDAIGRYTPIVIGVVLGLSFILLTVVFRSVVVPAKAIIMNLLSVGAAYGLMVLVFQKGVGADLLGFQQTDVIDIWLPVFLFSMLFGLSMDYHVFLLSRVRERYDQTKDNAEAVAHGLRATAGLITGAALIMVAVFSGFASGDMVGNQQMGFGLAVAVFLDATIVRTIMVPASMRLLGDWNWYLPRWLAWLPDLRVHAAEPAEATASAD
jgi:RND superfamily putative drug exporter